MNISIAKKPNHHSTVCLCSPKRLRSKPILIQPRTDAKPVASSQHILFCRNLVYVLIKSFGSTSHLHFDLLEVFSTPAFFDTNIQGPIQITHLYLTCQVIDITFMPTTLLITRDDIKNLPRGGVSILYSLAMNFGSDEVVVKPGRLPERRLAILLTLPLLTFGALIAAFTASSPHKEALYFGTALGVGIGLGGAMILWSFFASIILLQSLNSYLLVIDRATGCVELPRLSLSFKSSDGLVLVAYSHLKKGRRGGFKFSQTRSERRDVWITEVGLLACQKYRENDPKRYTPLWQRRVSRWLTWVAPTSTSEGVASQLRQLHEATGLPVLVIQAKNPKPLLIEGVEWDPIRERTF